jgi:CspA family cold shock protein
MADRKTGVVKWFNGQKGYGFVTPDDGSKDVFVHHTAILGEGYKDLDEGDRIEFNVEPSEKGPKAAQVIKL